MNTNTKSSVLTVLAPILVLMAAVLLFTSRGNLVASGFKFYIPSVFLLCLFKPKIGLQLCIFLATCVDMIKRVMLYDLNISSSDIALVLALVPVGITGLILHGLASVRSSWRTTPGMVKIVLLGSIVLALATVIPVVLDGGLRAMGGAVNSSLYLVFVGIIPVLVKTREEIIKVIMFTIMVFVPVALYGIYQGFYGFTDFELAYLESGLTIESRQLNEQVVRRMSSLGTSASLSTITGTFAGLSFSFVALNPKMRLTPQKMFVKVLMGIAFSVCAYWTFSRAGWLCGIMAFMIVIILKSKTLTIISMIMSIIGIITLYSLADKLWQDDVLRDIQTSILENSDGGAELEQAAKLVTWNARLESMSHFSRKSELWTPFGLKVAGTEHVKKGLWIHDPVTETLVKRGYIGLLIVFMIGIYALRKFFKFYWSLSSGSKDEKLLRFLFAGGGGIMVTGASHGASLYVFPTNLMWALFFGAVFSLIILITNDKKMAENKSSQMDYS